MRWEIDITRNSAGDISNISRRFFIDDVHQEDEDISYAYSSSSDLGIYVDGNIGWREEENEDGDIIRRYIRNVTNNSNGIGSVTTSMIENEELKGLEGETFGKFSIAARGDILITDNIRYADYEVPTSMTGFLDPVYQERLNSRTDIIGRNVYVVPRAKDIAFNLDIPLTDDRYFNIDAIIFATGLDQNNPDNSLTGHRRDIGAFGMVMHYQNVGSLGNQKPGSNSGLDFRDVLGVLRLRGSVLNYTSGFFGQYRVAGSNLDGMFQHYYFDRRLTVSGFSSYLVPGSGSGSSVFELIRLDRI